MDEKLKAILKQLHSRFSRCYGERLVRMILFGSQARGDAEEGSDLDIFVVLRGSVNPSEEISRTIDDVAEISLENDVVISCIFMEEDRFAHRNGPLLRNIRKEGVTV